MSTILLKRPTSSSSSSATPESHKKTKFNSRGFLDRVVDLLDQKWFTGVDCYTDMDDLGQDFGAMDVENLTNQVMVDVLKRNPKKVTEKNLLVHNYYKGLYYAVNQALGEETTLSTLFIKQVMDEIVIINRYVIDRLNYDVTQYYDEELRDGDAEDEFEDYDSAYSTPLNSDEGYETDTDDEKF